MAPGDGYDPDDVLDLDPALSENFACDVYAHDPLAPDPFRAVDEARVALATADSYLARLERAERTHDDNVLALDAAAEIARKALRAAALADAVDGTTTADPTLAAAADLAASTARGVLADLEELISIQRKLVAREHDDTYARGPLARAYADAKRDVARPLQPALEARVIDTVRVLARQLRELQEVEAAAAMPRNHITQKIVDALIAEKIDAETFIRASREGFGHPASEQMLRNLHAEQKDASSS